MRYSETQLKAYKNFLADSLFQVDTRWPHFNLLLCDLDFLAQTVSEEKTVVGMERTLLYGGYSAIAPLFSNTHYISIDCSPTSAEERGGYNDKYFEDTRAIKIKHNFRANLLSTTLLSESVDLVLIPNLVHHVEQQQELFAEMSRITKVGGYVYVFEPTLRELHQVPDDYLRYTPYGMQSIMKKVNLDPITVKTEGGPFSAVAYCWDQALQYIPEEEQKQWKNWFDQEKVTELFELDKNIAKI